MKFTGQGDLIKKEWRTLAAVGAIAIVLSAVFSGPTFITPQFRSFAISYPVNLQSYSVETRTDQLLQLLASNSIRDSLIKKFDLIAHYDVDTTDQGSKARLYNEFNDRVEVSKTRYESVLIEVEDEDPRIARDMVREMLYQLDLLARRLQREKSYELLHIAERSLDHERRKLDSVETRMREMSEQYGLLAYESQTRELVKGYVKALGRPGQRRQQEEIGTMLQRLQEQGGEFRHLMDLSNMFRGNYNRILGEYEAKVSDVTKELSYTNVIVHPEVSDKKTYPIRWLIVLVSVAASLLLAFVLLMMKERQRASTN